MPVTPVTKQNLETTRQEQGKLFRLQNLYTRSDAPAGSPQLIYTASSPTGHTQLNACTTSRRNDVTVVFAVGGSTGDVFGRDAGRQGSDPIVLAVRSDGTFIRGVQIPVIAGASFARSVATDAAARQPGLLVAAQNTFEDFTVSKTTIIFHRLDLDTLLPLQEESRLASYGFVQPLSMALSSRFTAESNQSVAFIAGNSRISADKKNDIVCNIHSRYASKNEEVTLYGMYLRCIKTEIYLESRRRRLPTRCAGAAHSPLWRRAVRVPRGRALRARFGILLVSFRRCQSEFYKQSTNILPRSISSFLHVIHSCQWMVLVTISSMTTE